MGDVLLVPKPSKHRIIKDGTLRHSRKTKENPPRRPYLNPFSLLPQIRGKLTHVERRDILFRNLTGKTTRGTQGCVRGIALFSYPAPSERAFLPTSFTLTYYPALLLSSFTLLFYLIPSPEYQVRAYKYIFLFPSSQASPSCTALNFHPQVFQYGRKVSQHYSKYSLTCSIRMIPSNTSKACAMRN